MKEYISTAEAAKILGVSRITVFNMIQDGRLKAKKFGRNYLIDPKELGGIFKEDLSAREKRTVHSAVARIIHDYGETLKLLGKE